MTEIHYDAAHHANLFDLEAAHFWFRARNRLVTWALGRWFPHARSLLEVGCGTGFVLSGIRAAFPRMDLSGSEALPGALAFARKRVPDATFFEMDARAIPPDLRFDVVCAFDVLEHIEEDDLALSEMARAAQSGVLITVPQHPWLWSSSDEHARHVRRYTASDLVAKIERAGLRVERITSFVSLLLPVISIARLRPARDPYAELRLRGAVNTVFGGVMGVERALIRRGVRFPAGGSLLAVARRETV